jgi:hypothetical protein
MFRDVHTLLASYSSSLRTCTVCVTYSSTLRTCTVSGLLLVFYTHAHAHAHAHAFVHHTHLLAQTSSAVLEAHDKCSPRAICRCRCLRLQKTQTQTQTQTQKQTQTEDTDTDRTRYGGCQNFICIMVHYVHILTVCICVCMYVCMHVCMYEGGIYIHTFTHMHLHTYIHTYIHTYLAYTPGAVLAALLTSCYCLRARARARPPRAQCASAWAQIWQAQLPASAPPAPPHAIVCQDSKYI